MIENILEEPRLYECVLKAAKFMKVMVFMCGPSGSGKSTVAESLSKDLQKEGISVEIHSTDSFFTKDGEYNFNIDLLHIYHEENRDKACKSKAQVVIVDNTNLIYSYVQKYTNITSRYIIKLYTKKVPLETLISQNTHSVSKSILEKMQKSYTIERCGFAYFSMQKIFKRKNKIYFDILYGHSMDMNKYQNRIKNLGKIHTFKIVESFNIDETKLKKRKRDKILKKGYISQGNCRSCGEFDINRNNVLMLYDDIVVNGIEISEIYKKPITPFDLQLMELPLF